MRRLIAILTLAITPAVSAGAQTLSTRDVIELSKAGLGEEVLLALIEVNRSVFPVDRATMKSLKDAGVAPAVIVAMVKSGRDQVEPSLPPSQPVAMMPQDIVDGGGMTARERELERELERAKDRELERDLERIRARRESQYVAPVAVPVPVYVPVPVRPRPVVKPAEPVYWGWDGKRRPDSWDPAPARDKGETRDANDARVPRSTLVPKGPGGGN
jgi:hypothetical protein